MRPEKKSILIATDLVTTHIDGVRTNYESIVPILKNLGYEILMLYVDENYSTPEPWNIGIFEPGLVMPNPFFVMSRTDEIIKKFKPDFVHIATEGVVGHSVRRYCLKRKWSFTSAYHTQWPAYLNTRFGIPKWMIWKGLAWFHGQSRTVFATNELVRRELFQYGISNIALLSRGVDSTIFSPDDPILFNEYPRPHWVNVGRVTPEKGLADFCKLNLPGTKFVIGDGIVRKELEKRYPATVFLGEESDRKKLARMIAGMDVFVFPSRSDTFGLVMIEANACGIPVAAYFDAVGPAEYIVNGQNGYKCDDLAKAAFACLAMSKTSSSREHALRFNWEKAANELINALVPIKSK